MVNWLPTDWAERVGGLLDGQRALPAAALVHAAQ